MSYKLFFTKVDGEIYQTAHYFESNKTKMYEEFFFPKNDVEVERIENEGKVFTFKTQENFFTYLKKLKVLKIPLRKRYANAVQKIDFVNYLVIKFNLEFNESLEAPQIIKDFEDIKKELDFQDAKKKKLKEIERISKVALVGGKFAEACGFENCVFMPQDDDNIKISFNCKSVIFPKKVLTLFEQGKVSAENFQRAIYMDCWIPLILEDPSYDEIKVVYNSRVILKNTNNLKATSFELKPKFSLENVEVSSSLEDFNENAIEICKDTLNTDFLSDLKEYTFYVPSFVRKLKGFSGVKKHTKEMIWR